MLVYPEMMIFLPDFGSLFFLLPDRWSNATSSQGKSSMYLACDGKNQIHAVTDTETFDVTATGSI